MALIYIQGGCAIIDHDQTGKPIWAYRYSDSLGYHEVLFDALGQTPIIGDQIDVGTHVLVPREMVPAEDNPLSPVWPEPIINNDPGFQKKKIHDTTWPEDFKG